MSKSRQEVPEVYSTEDNRFLDISERSPFLTSNGSRWTDINLASFDLPAAEMTEYSIDRYGIGINIGQGFQLERVLEGTVEEGFIPPGGSCLCPSYYRQAYRWDRRNQIVYLNLTPELLSLQATALLKTDCVEIIPQFAIQDQLIYQIGLALQAELRSQGSSGRLYAEAMAAALAVHLLRHYTTQGHRTINCNGGFPQHKLRLVIDYINDNLEYELSLKELAALVQLSQYHFCRVFRQATGLSPHQYLVRQRIEKAKELLQKGGMSIAAVAVACGFTHQSHLHRHFKRLTGVTPKTFLNS
ncbi:AraC family transcriptional regulator [Dendronalium sp. ChiSLP03b]|uniref:AraC family transcriptional regulator n=1 Tax=Dendronalium sp. ChiSLP03b TaxID=3075381 RepID=UPI002AD4EFD3|nr:AraC family transcriptional regulator [Dendronalium sp. ChiSLP03b]MDZ8209325.1 AraC family transcriptional regulator [Dendronalium sp. ChiSLP03b]